MSHYYFDVCNGVDVSDSVGLDLADDKAALHHARSVVAKYASDPHNLASSGHIVVTVRTGPTTVLTTTRLVFQEDLPAVA